MAPSPLLAKLQAKLDAAKAIAAEAKKNTPPIVTGKQIGRAHV